MPAKKSWERVGSFRDKAENSQLGHYGNSSKGTDLAVQ